MTKPQFHRSSPKITICERLREINDLHQTNSEHDIVVRKLLVDAQIMAKKMSKKLLDYNVDVFKDFWERNPDHLKNLKKRISRDYLGNSKSGVAEKDLKLFVSKINSKEGHGKYIADDLINSPVKIDKNGCIVETGSWLGQAAAYIALGIKKNNRHDLEFHCFDSWKATEEMCEKNKNVRLKPKENLLPHFEENLSPFNVKVHTHRVKPVKAKWRGPSIDLFVFNSGVFGKQAKKVLKIFSPFFVKNKTIVLWMDYHYYEEDKTLISWKEKMASLNSFELMKRIENSKVAVFKYIGEKVDD